MENGRGWLNSHHEYERMPCNLHKKCYNIHKTSAIFCSRIRLHGKMQIDKAFAKEHGL